MRYVFGDCEFDAARCELRCAGKIVLVEPKVFKVLAYLIAHRDRVVHKDELLEHFHERIGADALPHEGPQGGARR
jgi:DNA-binding winged helix-turn-helix (wHTH) protein